MRCRSHAATRPSARTRAIRRHPDLRAFFARGGKLILRENAGDRAQSPVMGIEYYQSLVARLGQAEIDRSVRFYMSPASTHTGNARSATDKTAVPTMVDLLDPLDRWVTAGSVPADVLVQTRRAALPPFAVEASRPLCRYPGHPHYAGGDRLQASSYVCQTARHAEFNPQASHPPSRHRSVDTGASGFDCDRPGTPLQGSRHHAPLRVHDVGQVGHDLLFDQIARAGQHFQLARDALVEQALQFIAGGESCSPQGQHF